jgi:mRNA interferase MazF
VGLRPVLALSNELFNNGPQLAGFPLTMALAEGALPKPSWLKISQVRTAAFERLGGRIASIGHDTAGKAPDGLLELIGQ